MHGAVISFPCGQNPSQHAATTSYRHLFMAQIEPHFIDSAFTVIETKYFTGLSVSLVIFGNFEKFFVKTRKFSNLDFI